MTKNVKELLKEKLNEEKIEQSIASSIAMGLLIVGVFVLYVVFKAYIV